MHFLLQQHGIQTALHELLGHRLVVAVEGRHLGRHLPEGRVILPDDAAAEHRGRLDVERQHLRDTAELEGREGGGCHAALGCGDADAAGDVTWRHSPLRVLKQEARTGRGGEGKRGGWDTRRRLCKDKKTIKAGVSSLA